MSGVGKRTEGQLPMCGEPHPRDGQIFCMRAWHDWDGGGAHLGYDNDGKVWTWIP